MTAQLAFSHCPFTELHSAPNDGKDSNHPTRLRPLCRAGRAGKVLQRDQQHLCSRCLCWSGGKISTGFLLLQTRAPHLSKEKSQLLFFPRGRNRSSPTGRTEQEKELRLNLCLVNTTNPPSPGTTGVAGEGSLGSATSWKAGQEMKSPVSWCSYCTHRL